MALVDDNIFPKLILVEGTAPASPSASDFKLYVDSSDHLFKMKNSAGVVTTFGAGFANPMTTAGDTIYGGASGVATRLAGGTSGYVMTSNGATSAPSWQAGGGGGGSDVVNVASGAGSVTIPGLKGSPDAVPGSPSAYDDEFGALSGWTTLGTLDTSNVTDFPSNWHAIRTEAGVAYNGIYKAAPTTPFTVTARLNAAVLTSGHQSTGIFLYDGTKIASVDLDFAATTGLYAADLRKWTNRTTFSAAVAGSNVVNANNNYYPVPKFVRIVVTSASSIAGYWSVDGYLWVGPIWTGQSTGLSAVTYVGLGISEPIAGGTVEAVWDWIRFT